MTYVDRFAAITNADEQMDLLEPLVTEFYEDEAARTPEIAEAVLRMFERNAEADGFGTFGTLISALEYVDEAALKPLIEASLARQESWPVQELAQMFADDE